MKGALRIHKNLLPSVKMKGEIPHTENKELYSLSHLRISSTKKEAGCALNFSTKPGSNNSTSRKEAKKHQEVHVSDN